MKGILVYQPPGRASQVAAFIEDLEPRLREKIIRQLYRLTLPQKPEMKEPYFKRFSLERYQSLCELRVKTKLCVRVIFYPCANGDTLLLYAFVKRQKRDTMQALEQSLSILDALREHSERAVEYKVREEGA